MFGPVSLLCNDNKGGKKKKKKPLHFHHFGLLLHSLIFGSCKDLLADQHYTVNWVEVGLPSYSVKYRNPVDGLT